MPMTYDSLENDRVRFLQGTQAQLNKFLPVSTTNERGTAIEGAFYLTTDTHRLYVGRKVNDANSTDNGKIFPVQVSAGITTVADTGQLAQLATDGEKGDMYYIQDGNVLAVLEIDSNGTRSWVQINPPTGITGFNTDTIAVTNGVKLNSFISTQAGNSPTASVVFNEGQNIELTTVAADNSTNPVTPASITINAAKYELETTATPNNSTNGAEFGLVKNDGNSYDTSISLSADSTVTSNGTNTIAVTSDNAGNITLQGPRFKSLESIPYQTARGFQLKLNYYNPLTNNSAAYVDGDLDPIIEVGTNSTINGTAYTPQSVHFTNGTASLPLYTRAETDSRIQEYVTNQLSTANAMNYRGIITSAVAASPATGTSLDERITTNGAHAGDTYKVSTTDKDGFTINGQRVYNGDLVILSGTENAQGIIPTNQITYEIVPSGDEPLLGAQVTAYSSGRNAGVAATTTVDLRDTKTGGYGSILLSKYKGSNYINVSSTWDSSNKIFELNFEHEDVSRTNGTNTLTPLTGTVTDGLGKNAYQFFMLSSATDVTTDAKGHVTGVKGTLVNFKHNYLTALTPGVLVSSAGSNTTVNENYISYGLLNLSAEDAIGYTTTSQTRLGSHTLQFTKTTETIGSNQVDVLNVDLLWGSF